MPSGRQTISSMYLLDPNALSELLKKRPKPQFLTRLRRHPPEMFFTSSICVMELRHGSRRRADHEVFWQRITHEVLSRVTILDFSISEAVVAGDILAHLARRGELIGVEDVLIGATALVWEYKQIPRSSRRNPLPVKRIDRSLLMGHEYVSCALVELMQIGKAPPGANPVLHHPPEAFDRVEVVATMRR